VWRAPPEVLDLVNTPALDRTLVSARRPSLPQTVKLTSTSAALDEM
jgi:hypothetical protein